MAQKNDRETGISTQSSQPALSEPKVIKNDSPSAFCRYSNVVFPLIAIIALLLAGFASYQNWQLHNLQAQQDEKIENRLKEQQSNTGNQLEAIDKSLQDSALKLQTRVNALNTNLQKALKQRLYQKQDWLLLQARYYLELAQINAHWSQDQKTTTALLQEADSVLQEMSMQELLPVRQAIATEMAQLKALPVIDITGLLSQLDAAKTLVSDLPIKQSLSDPDTTIHNKPKINSSSSWRNTLDESMTLLQKLVVVRHHEGDINPILSPLHQALLRETVRMNLQQAQWAVLQNNAAVFNYSLTEAIKEIEKIFENNAKSTRSLIEQLQALQETRLDVAAPSVDRSLKLLNQLIESSNSSGVLPASTTGDETP